jgi:hypothetical protein
MGDMEIRAITVIGEALEPLDSAARERVLVWAKERYGTAAGPFVIIDESNLQTTSREQLDAAVRSMITMAEFCRSRHAKAVDEADRWAAQDVRCQEYIAEIRAEIARRSRADADPSQPDSPGGEVQMPGTPSAPEVVNHQEASRGGPPAGKEGA